MCSYLQINTMIYQNDRNLGLGGRVCLTATTGWAGSALAKGIFESQVLKLVGAISKSNSSKVLGSFIDQVKNTLLILSTVAEVLLSKPEVFIEYAKPEVVKRNILKLHSWHRELNSISESN